jgi:hypothetical protein
MSRADVIRAIAATAELCGKTFSPAAAAMLAADLADYDEQAVMVALTRCRKELKGSFTAEAVISRIDDSRPGVEEAWAMLPHDEETSTVWTEEMAKAWGVALPLLNDGDRIGARMAFKEAYTKLVTTARNEKIPARWTVSFGRDAAGRVVALESAVRNRRIGVDHAVQLLPFDAAEGLLRTLGVQNHPLLVAPSRDGQKKVRELLLTLKGKTV